MVLRRMRPVQLYIGLRGHSHSVSACAPPVKDVDLTVGYLGAPGSFTEEIAVNVFQALHLPPPIRATASPVSAPGQQNITALLKQLLENKFDFIMIPVYNSLAGAVQVHQDLLSQFKSQIEVLPLDIVMPIRLDLMVLDKTVQLSDLRVIKSHPAALAESSDFLQELLLEQIREPTEELLELDEPDEELSHNKDEELRTEPATSTSAAAKEIAETGNRTLGALASSRAAAMYNLHVLQADVQGGRNATRFVLLKRGGGVLLSELLADHRLDTVEAVPELQKYTTDQARKTVLGDIGAGGNKPHHNQCGGGVEETETFV